MTQSVNLGLILNNLKQIPSRFMTQLQKRRTFHYFLIKNSSCQQPRKTYKFQGASVFEDTVLPTPRLLHGPILYLFRNIYINVSILMRKVPEGLLIQYQSRFSHTISRIRGLVGRKCLDTLKWPSIALVYSENKLKLIPWTTGLRRQPRE